MNRMNGLGAVIIALAVVVLMGVPANAQDQDGLTVWMKKGFVEEQNDMFLERAAEFAEAHGVPVDVQLIAYEDFYPKWTAAIETHNVPDISWFGYQEVGQFSAQGVLLDLSDLVAKVQRAGGDMYPTSISAVTRNSVQWAVPFWVEGTALYYRTDMFEKAGLDAPDTWEEFRQAAIALTDPRRGVYGAGLGFGRGNSDAEWLTRAMIWGYGGSLFEADGETPVADNAGTRALMEYIRTLFLVDKVTPVSATNWDDSGNNTAYLTGQAAMIVNTGSVVSALRNDHPELLQNTDVVVLPTGPEGRYVAGISNNLAIFRDSSNVELAKAFIEWVLQPDWYNEWIKVSVPLAVPVYEELAKDPVWQNPYHKPFVESAEYFAFLGQPGPYTPAAGTVYNMRVINDVFQEMLINDIDADEAAERLQSRMVEVLREGK